MDPGLQATPVAFVRGEGLDSSGAPGPDRGPVQSPQGKPAFADKKTSPPNDIPQPKGALTQWNGTDDSAWEALQQWLQFVPQRLHERLRWHGGHSHLPPQDETNLLLYAGKDDETSLDSCIRHLFPSMTPTIVALDIRRDGKEVEHDLLMDQPYNDLCRRALAGHIAGTGGGPNCRTWSILRWIPKPGAPPPVRGRKEPHCWGLDSLKASDQQLVDDDSVLLLRQMVITHLAFLGRRHRGLPDPWNFLEHPVDPKHNSRAPSAWRCSSIWATRALRTWHHLMGNTFLTFDQCRLGQVVKKTTTLTTNLHLRHWEGMVCNHSPEAHKQSESLSSADLSRYPWAMMQGLAAAIHEHYQETPDLRSSQQPCSAAASGADHGPGASKKPRLGLSPAEWTSHSPGGTSPPEGTGHTSTSPASRAAKTRTEGMNPAEGKTRESQALGTNLDEHPTNQGAVPQHPNSASGTSREMVSEPRQDGGIPPLPMNNSQRLNSACGSSREEPSGHTHQPTVGHGLTSGGSPPQVGETPKNPNSACGTSREGALGVSSYATNHSGLDRPSYLPTTARLHLLDDQMLVPLGFRVRPLRDGGGKTSPGRVPPPLRPPTPLAEKGRLILTKVQSLTKDFLHSISKHEKHHPFSDDLLRDVRQILVGPTNETVTPGQPFYLDAIHDVAKQLQDADQDYPLTVKEGVPLGVTTPTLTSPGIWPTKAELKGEDPTLIDLPYPTGRANYSSAEQFTEDIKTTFREERALQMVEGPFTTTEAANYCGCTAEELCPGPMAAIDEGDKIRTIYDGSWGGANAHIQRNTEECTTAPTVMDCVHCIHWLRAARGIPPPERAGAAGPDTCAGGGTDWVWPTPTTQWSILKADVTKAHRRIKIHQEDWKFQVAHIGDEWWVNKVGTYGMASAQLYWGRMAALLLRIVYAIFPGIDWGFVFVDDFAWLIREPQSAIYSTAILVLLLSLGTPLSWKKTVLNPVNTWLGFVIDPTGPIVQMATDKNSLVLNLLDKLAAGDVFTLKDLEKGMGRLQWATSACPLTKPLLQPLWQWKGVLRSSGRPNHLIRVFARMLRLLFQEPYVQPTPCIFGLARSIYVQIGVCLFGRMSWFDPCKGPAALP